MRPLLRPLLWLVTAATICLSAGSAVGNARHAPGPITRAALRADRECATSGKLTHRHSVRVLTVALRILPSDIAEYTDCVSVLRAARRRAASRHGHHGRSRSGVRAR